MKVSIKAGTKLLKSFGDNSKIAIKITRLVEEFLPMLIGMELYFGISPQQYVNQLQLENAESVIRALIRGGYAEGSTHDWKLSKSTYKTVSDRLCKTGAIGSKIGYSASEPPVSVLTLVKSFRHHLKRLPKEVRTQKVTNMFAFFRRLSKKHNSVMIHDKIKLFFKRQRHNSDYTLETFRLFLEGHKQTLSGERRQSKM
jgi:hypothetical protein